MGFLLIVLFILVLANSVSYANSMMAEQQKLLKKKIEETKETGADYIVEQPKSNDFVVEDVVKFCPPHKWRYQEVRDTQGNTVRYRIICDLCGPLKPTNGPAKVS